MNSVHVTAKPPLFPQPVNLQVHHCSWQMRIHHSKDLELNLSCTEDTDTYLGARRLAQDMNYANSGFLVPFTS